MPTLLAVDDDPLILKCFRHAFRNHDVTLVTATSVEDGVRLYHEHRPDSVVLDLRLPDAGGMDAFRRFHALDERTPIVLMTGYGTAATAIEAMQLGAYEYVVKPVDPAVLVPLVVQAFEVGRLMRTPAKLGTEAANAAGDGDLLVGTSAGMQTVYKAIGRVATQDVTVLIHGESGTGKELVARALYHYSRRNRGPFLAVNCAAIPEALLESELFGHEKGAFTGADRRRIGKFEQCHGGTLFLDEIGDMTLLTQAKMLRVMQEQRFERVGGNETVQTDVRLIAATHRDLGQASLSGVFRADLYYRLSVYTVRVPPLRERPDDIPQLVDFFLRKFARELGRASLRSASPAMLDLLAAYPWPGNVRELQSVLKQAILQAVGPVLHPEFLPASVREGVTPSAAASGAVPFPDLTEFIQGRLRAGSTNLFAEVQATVESELLREVLAHTDGNQSQAARVLGISRPTLRTKLGAASARSPTP